MRYFFASLFFCCSNLLAKEPEKIDRHEYSKQAIFAVKNDLLDHIEYRLGYLRRAADYCNEYEQLDENYYYYLDLIDEYNNFYRMIRSY